MQNGGLNKYVMNAEYRTKRKIDKIIAHCNSKFNEEKNGI
jgi:hypothetical protein